MFEKYTLLTRGFKNVVEDGAIVGFQLKIRIPYFRGIPLACIDGIEVTVDSESFTLAEMRFTIEGRSYTRREMENAVDVRWPWAEPAILTVLKPKGLPMGIRDVTLTQNLRISFSSGAGANASTVRKRMTLVV